MKKHWLYRPENVRKLWVGGGLLLAVVLGAQLVISLHGHFGVDEWFGFYAVYGFATCVLMVILAKLLGLLIKRSDSYYDD